MRDGLGLPRSSDMCIGDAPDRYLPVYYRQFYARGAVKPQLSSTLDESP
jgi:hypothetical protein